MSLELSVITSDACAGPTVCGLKVTEMMHWAPAATVLPQLLTMAKSEA
jgi:hypothetical protein